MLNIKKTYQHFKQHSISDIKQMPSKMYIYNSNVNNIKQKLIKFPAITLKSKKSLSKI